MEEELKPGDVVTVRGLDGPKMTVDRVCEGEVLCGWFDVHANFHEHKFSADRLVKVD